MNRENNAEGVKRRRKMESKVKERIKGMEDPRSKERREQDPT